MSVPAGWYPDSQPGVLRYWDGNAWTQHTHVTAEPVLVEAPRSRKKPDSNGRAWLKVLGLVAVGTVLVALLANGCEAINRNQKPAHYTYVVYTADSSSKTGSVTYSTPDGTRQENDQTLPFRYSHVVTHIGDHYYVSVQNGGDGVVACSITVDGQVIASNRSSGPYAIATCSGTW